MTKNNKEINKLNNENLEEIVGGAFEQFKPPGFKPSGLDPSATIEGSDHEMTANMRDPEFRGIY